MSELDIVSIIIPTLNSEIIDLVLGALVDQSSFEAIGEIIVVGRDEKNKIDLGQYPLINFIDTGVPVNAAKARNIGIEAAQNQLLVFLDSDCLPVKDWLASHLAAHRKGAKIVGGGVIASGTNYWNLAYNLTLFHEYLSYLPQGVKNYFPTLNLSVQKEVIQEIGLLNEKLLRGQDIEWTRRMVSGGYKITFVPEAAVVHRHNRSTFKAVWRDCARSGYFMRQARLSRGRAHLSRRIIYNRNFLFWGAPLIAVAVTGKIILLNPRHMISFWYTFPAIYLSKIAWCWGASRRTWE